jgi:hypothetical protein
MLWIILAFTYVSESRSRSVGYISPGGVFPAFVDKVQCSQINVRSSWENDRPTGRIDKAWLVSQLELAQKHAHTVHMDLTHLITDDKPADKISMKYHTSDGSKYTKHHPPLVPQKMRVFKKEPEFRSVVTDLALTVAKYRDVVGFISLVDEPYLNGVSMKELEDAAVLYHKAVHDAGEPEMSLMVIFTGAMFHRKYARMLAGLHGNYARIVDVGYEWWENNKENETLKVQYEKYVASIPHRMTTYDQAGNLYTGGGIPKGYAVVAADDYISTFLEDPTRQKAMQYYYANTRVPECSNMRYVTMKSARAKLSFYNSSSTLTEVTDRQLLDKLFKCKSRALTKLLTKSISRLSPKPKLMLIGESGSFCFIEHSGRAQNQEVIDRRVSDEIKRSIEFMKSYEDIYDAGMLFFPFEDSIDHQIHLKFGGVSSNKYAQYLINDFAGRNNSRL